MIRLFYTLLIYVAAPLFFAATLWRGLRDPLYRGRLTERFGFGKGRVDRPSIWVHAASVGEVQAGSPLIGRLRRSFPDDPLVVTTTTPTGAARVKALFGNQVMHSYLPYDTPCAVRRFLGRARPRVLIAMETEVWPNLYLECASRRIPIVLASARLSEKSARRFRWGGSLFRDALRTVAIGAQSAADAQRYLAIGASAANVRVTGNIKFDLEIADDIRTRGHALRAAQFADRFVWVAGSTHEGEEDVVVRAHRKVLATRADALLILVPRHPDRFERVRQWLAAQQLSYVSRSAGTPVDSTIQVLLGDTLGELLMIYAASDVAFVGGSLVPVGGHNLLEPAALARPVLTGPYCFNAPDVAQLLLGSHAALEVGDADALARSLLMLAADAQRGIEMGQAGCAVIERNRGALGRVMEIIEQALRD